MTYDNRFTGAITITPPLTRSQIAKVVDGFCPAIKDVKLRISNTEEVTEDGDATLIRSTADAIVPLPGPYTGYNIVDDIQTLVDYFSEHEFDGYIQVQWDSGFGDPVPTRYVIAGRRVVEVRPTLVWPGETYRDEKDVQAVAEACSDFGNEEGPRGIRQLYARFKDSIEALNAKEGK